MASKVPADVGALLAEHGNFIPFVINKIIRHHLSQEEREDLTQDILLTLHARKYLDRCRVYEAQCAVTGKPYTFLSSFRPFIERLTKNYLRDRHAAKRDPRVLVSLDRMRGVAGDRGGRDREDTVLVPEALTYRPTIEDAAIASARLDRMRETLVAGRRVIGGVPAAQVLDAAVADGGDLDKYARRRVRAAVESPHAAA